MSGDRFDYRSERARHENFVGRTGLLARLDQLLVEDAADRWVVITGGPGMGKSALLAAWLARRVAAGAVVPHHFIRRGLYDWDDPAKLVGSLVTQLEDGLPELREPEADDRMHPAMRLSRALSRVSEHALVPRGARLVVLIDGLDEYDPPPERSTGDPLAAFLPGTLPAGVRLLCASRPRHPYVSSLYTRDCELVQLDLDDPSHAADNDATVRAFWDGAAEPLHLDARFIDEAVARADGNVQHAVQLRKRLAVLPPEQRRVEDIPRGLAALIEKSWARVAVDPAVVTGLGILCAAREALTLDEIGAVADWGGDPQCRTWVRAAKELLVETQRPGGQLEYRLHHDAIRGYVAQTIGDAALRTHHRALARRYATWPAPGQADARRYALRHALIHRAEAGDWAEAWRLAGDMSFLEAKCRELGVHETEVDIARVAERCRASDDAAVARRLGDLARALGRDSHWIRPAPDATAGLVWNRLRRFGWPADELGEQLRGVDHAGFLRVRHAVTRESPALVRDLVGHAGGVNACAVTPDGRRVVSASDDRTLKVWDLETGRPLATLKVWDLETGRLLATLEGHADWVRTCAVTPDGRRVVSASHDRTLKVWDLETYACLVTHRGDAPYTAVATSATAIVAGDATGGLWIPDWPPSPRRTTPERMHASDDHPFRSDRPDVPPSPRLPMTKHTIQSLPTNPLGTDPMNPSVARTAPTSSTPKVDIGIVTIRDDEFSAVLDVFPSEAGIAESKHRKYPLRHADAGNGQHYTIAVLRQIEKGQGEALAATRDLIDDLAPRLVLVVGIAGGLPSDDVKLGDVVLSMRIQDFTVEARKYGKKTQYAVTGGPVVTSLAADVAILEARKSELGDWTAGLPPQPAVTWTKKNQLYGPPAWRSELRAKLKHHYGEATTPRAPRFIAGTIASSDRLVKDPELVIPWLTTSRDLLAIEMESGGVYRASQDRCPMLAIRGISDIVGLKRADAWTKYACASAAAFTRGFLRTRPIKLATAATGTVEPSSDRSSKANPAQATHDRPASSPRTEEMPMTHDELLTQLSELLPSQFEEVLYRAKVPPKHLPGASAAQTARAVEALRYIEQHKQLEDLARIVRQVLDPR